MEHLENLKLDRETLGYDKSNSIAIIVGLAFMVIFRFVGYLATKAPKVSALGRNAMCLVVLGDIGHSPRMLLHARSALNAGYKVDFVGYKGSRLPEDLENHSSIHFHYIKELPRVPESMPKIVYYLYAPIKAFILSWQLFLLTMFKVPAPEVYLVQNPPSLPTLHVMQIVNWLRQRHLVIDWHNYGESVVANRLGANSIFTKAISLYERFWGFKATIHITVSRTMARDLLYKYEKRGKVATLYDRAPASFRRLDVDEVHELMGELKLEQLVKDQTLNSGFLPAIGKNQTLFTEKKSAKGPATFRSDRPILIVSSTSWTADEDFQLLLNAAKQYDDLAKDENKGKKIGPISKLLFVITGKGPLKQHYEEIMSKMNFEYVAFVTAWLTPEDYPRLLGSADLGVSLHTSSSGVDLPMKVVDMFGCGLPVCAFNYSALSELVVAKSNGLIFENASELRSQLVHLFKNFPLDQPETHAQLASMRQVIAATFQNVRWEDNWNSTLFPLLRNLDKTWADAQMYAENPVDPVYNFAEGEGEDEDDLEEEEFVADEAEAEDRFLEWHQRHRRELAFIQQQHVNRHEQQLSAPSATGSASDVSSTKATTVAPSTVDSAQQVTGSTLASNSEQYPQSQRVNAAFVILLQNKDLHEMRKTMRQLEQTFNHRHGYPYVFLNNVPFTDHFMVHIQAMTMSKVHFGLIPKEHWSYPDFINQTQAALNRQEMESRKVPYGESESYRHMCRYMSGFIFRHELVLPYDYYWRVEPGVAFSCDLIELGLDPFMVMKTRQLKYGFTIALPEYIGTIPTLWENVKKFKELFPEHLAKRNSLDWISYDKGDTYNNCHFWSNFEIVDASFFRSKAYMTFFELLDQSGGFFYERWGDAPVHSIAAALLLERKEIHFFNEIGYRHGMYEHCPESPTLQLKCSCDPADNVDWVPYSCLRRFLET
ncbi:alpha 1,2-mannosyltransferase 2.4.1 [Podila humilis]|nr:alpha 1,2-mannosyltransferase 2.4.1 [Podila humilis]